MGDGDVVLKRAHTNHGEYEEDVIAEILAKLPVKSLIRFRCVCKSWRALISDPYFVKKHFSWRAETYKVNFDLHPPLFVDLKALENIKNGDDVQFAVTELDFPVSESIPDPGYRRVVGSCNGLVCVEVDFKAIMLWNPYTRDSKVLPTPPGVIKKSYGGCYDFYGLGYDSATDDYKVILGVTYYDDANGANKIMIHIFALKTGSWRTVQGIDYVELDTRLGLFVNGALHWLYNLPGVGSRILLFDLGEEKFQKTVPLPYDDWLYDPLIYRNCLCVCSCPAESNSIHIWMMKEYGVKESWTELVQFSLDNCVLGPGDYRQYFKPVCIFENGVVLINEMGNYERLVVFSDLKEKTFEHFVQVSQDLGIRTVIYRETLVSPDVHTYKTNYVRLLYPLTLEFY
ncbi:PREDICTED: F-box/kelch-repeat protein At3g23880-like [Fragaria vesca subsp. vesca]|uniref:F-box/kelch-repeat protein At3g23880-like n=1 Tax=Fragaria vesca subsp. vesca TaxID=101020 RepID=UPI0002C35A0B|nr:PREDICTED: F-box/kelch-repeat protein At3g23880-like [Fragaria vesca subsp. vesca]